MRRFFKHFKGGIYEVVASATHTETGEGLILYVSIEEPNPIWARPEAMFHEEVRHNGFLVPRFRKITNSEAEAAKDALKASKR